VASVVAGYFGDLYGFRYAFFIPALVLFVVLVLYFFFQRNTPSDVGLPTIEEYHNEEVTEVTDMSKGELSSEGGTSWSVIRQVFRNKVILKLGFVYFCMKPTRYGILFWGPVYLNERLGTNMLESGLLSGLFEFAGIISVFLGGVISDFIFRSRRMPVSVLCLLFLGLLLCCISWVPATSFWLGLCFFMIGLFIYAPDSIVAGVAPVDFAKKHSASTASGFINGCGSIGAIAGGTLPGILKDQWGWDNLFYLFAGMIFLGCIILAPMWNAVPSRVGNATTDKIK